MSGDATRGEKPTRPEPREATEDAAFIPREHLPPGFAESIEEVPEEPARPRPAATVVLMRAGATGARNGEGGGADALKGAAAGSAAPGRAGAEGLEILLLRRVRSSGFVPGAWVFPGGRVDSDDAEEALVARLEGLGREGAARRLGVEDGAAVAAGEADEEPPAIAFWIAALREAFEETGILVARDASGSWLPSAGADPTMERLRMELLEDEDRFPRILDRAGGTLDGSAVAYIAHWITPVVEPRRYDTRFFAAAVGARSVESLSVAEISEGRWMTPTDALDRHRAGEMPMVFPTVHTVEMLADFDSPAAVLEHFRSAHVPTILPRLVRRDGGVAIEVP